MPNSHFLRTVLFACLAVTTTGQITACSSSAIKPPRGSIQVGNDLYAVPIGKKDDCTHYRLWSPTKLTTSAIHYIDKDKKITLDESKCAR